MKLNGTSIFLVCSTLLIVPAWSFEQLSTTEIRLESGAIVATSEAKFDPETGAFSRTGEITLKRGQVLNYSVSGTCDLEKASCAFTGEAKGPLGGAWQAEGTVVRSAETLSISADVLAPNGQSMSVNREVAGDLPTLEDILGNINQKGVK